ncbi:5-epiaristolochene 1,3-dihydroxylase [Brachypodium distachyon]|uniref:Cytochrome P450 n=1 Tax=Brachypodium distachyon TaxID=15368 RepID=I1IW70_BRADI|nr:5-epiaristolochene 1,3-dihydroxylase [Brachypodium distachyon]KQJ81810.2 hypothetical protein BRADI_5g03227v3 [Brachypodium distachyon]|eukprot:XP_003581036.1 5-epiaristolochene 1,3-dihydroxylase [Brachypodium distachyon]
MEVLSFCFISLATAVLLWFVKLKASPGDEKKLKKQHPPGPWTLPIIGSLHHLIGGLPHHKITELSRRHGPVMFLKLGEVPNVVVSSAEAAELVMKTKDLTFATRPSSMTLDIVGCGGKGIVLAPYGDHWRQMRKLCIVELLNARQVKRVASIRAEEVARLLRSVAAAASAAMVFNLSKEMAVLSNDIVMRAVFGGKCTQQSEYLHQLEEMIRLLGGFVPADLFPSSRLVRWLTSDERDLKSYYGGMQCIIGDIIEERKAKRGADRACGIDDEDFLDVLLRLQEEDSLAFPLTSETMGVVMTDMFGAGSETTSNTLAWAMSELLRSPKSMVKAQLEVRKALGQERAIITNTDLGELQYLRMVIKEVLRLHPSSPLLIPREAREDCEIMGYNISKGTKIHVNVFAIARDPKYWDNPEAFKPERFENNDVDYKGTNFEFTPFGAGRRLCPGMLFGTSTLEIALANLLYHFDWVLPDGASPKSIDMSEKFGLAVGRKHDLKVIAIPRTCAVF